MEQKINIDQFICDLIESVEYDSTKIKRQNIMWALMQQGIYYKGGKLLSEKPEYHVGDYLFNDNTRETYIIKEIARTTNADVCGYYVCRRLSDNHQVSYYFTNNNIRLWTIRDAKDGDVLTCESTKQPLRETGIIKQYVGKYGGCEKCFETYAFVDWDGIFRVGEYMGSKEIHPATEEEKKYFFDTMHRLGYEWNSDEKMVVEKRDVKPMDKERFMDIAQPENKNSMVGMEGCTDFEKQLYVFLNHLPVATATKDDVEQVKSYTKELLNLAESEISKTKLVLSHEVYKRAIDGALKDGKDDGVKEAIARVNVEDMTERFLTNLDNRLTIQQIYVKGITDALNAITGDKEGTA